MSNYSPQMIEKLDSKLLPLATASVLGQAPSIKGILAGATLSLAEVSPTADLDARVLLEHTLERGHAWLMAHGNEPMDSGNFARYQHLVEERRRGKPIAHITGFKEFWSLRLKISDSVLIPRPETEHLVEHALLLIPGNRRLRIADLGTGSGAVAVAIASERPLCTVSATDISTAALNMAAANANHLNIDNIRFCCGHWFRALAGEMFDLIVANPPYIAADEACLKLGDLAHEPTDALQAGPKGLDALQALGAGAAQHLAPGGWILVEHGHDQQHEVARIFEKSGLRQIECYPDHAGHPRVTVGRNITTHAGV
jgi:release factor glutamine methyltransferase